MKIVGHKPKTNTDREKYALQTPLYTICGGLLKK
jgi:hypothetical protein